MSPAYVQRTSRGRTIAGFAAIGAGIAALSAAAPITYDEGDWLAVARRMALGDSLYRDIVDNKSPPIYWVMRGLDGLPGPFPLARGLFLAALAVWLGAGARALAVRLGVPDRAATLLGIGISLAAAAQATLVLNIEVAAAAIVMGSLLAVAGGRAMPGGLVAASAVVIDPRALVLVAGVVAFAWEHGGRRTAIRTVLGASSILGWVAYLALSDDARYAVIELNAATRGTLSDWRPGAVLAVAIISSLPAFAAFIAATGSPTRDTVRAVRRSVGGSTLLAGAVTVSLASAFPFYKYWIAALPSLPLLVAGCYRAGVARPERMPRGVNPGFVIGLALLPVAAHAVQFTVDQSRVVTRYERAARQLDRLLEPSATFVAFDTQPFFTTFLPQRSSLPWAVQDFLAVENSRRASNLAAISRALDRAAALVDDGALSVDEQSVEPGFREAWRLFRSRVDGFPCVRRIDGLTLRLRAGACA